MTKKVKPGICKKCGEKISNKENFVHLMQYNKGEFFSEGWYHVSCFREGIHGTVQQRDLMRKTDAVADKMLNLLGGIQ